VNPPLVHVWFSYEFVQHGQAVMLQPVMVFEFHSGPTPVFISLKLPYPNAVQVTLPSGGLPPIPNVGLIISTNGPWLIIPARTNRVPPSYPPVGSFTNSPGDQPPPVPQVKINLLK
jgi:hypothetical protein